METWFLLYGGSSVDGRGAGEYVGRTTDKQAAIAHHQKCENNPYSAGYVLIIKDDSAERAWGQTDWSKV